MADETHEHQFPEALLDGTPVLYPCLMCGLSALDTIAAMKAEAQRPDYWRCRTCGCVWRDNHDDTVSLGGPTQKSCQTCEWEPTANVCEPLYRRVEP